MAYAAMTSRRRAVNAAMSKGVVITHAGLELSLQAAAFSGDRLRVDDVAQLAVELVDDATDDGVVELPLDVGGPADLFPQAF